MRTIIVSALGLLTLAVLVTALLTTRSTGEQTPLPAPIVAPAAPVQSAPGTSPAPDQGNPAPTTAPEPVAPDGLVPPPPLPPADWDDDFDDDWDDDDDD